MNERQGSAVLRRVFEARGLSLVPDFDLSQLGAFPAVRLDGFDPAARVGFEWLTTEAGDHPLFSDEVVAALDAAVASGAVHLLLVDESEALDEPSLVRIGDRFLDRLAAEGRLSA